LFHVILHRAKPCHACIPPYQGGALAIG
jgi:hypothetical protein